MKSKNQIKMNKSLSQAAFLLMASMLREWNGRKNLEIDWAFAEPPGPLQNLLSLGLALLDIFLCGDAYNN